MTRKRKNRRNRRTDFATVQEVTERIISGGADYLDENIIRLMQASGELRDEREFADFTLDPQQTLEAAAHHFARFRRRLSRAARRDKDKAAMVYDDYRIAALEDLDTPQLREEVRRRLNRFVARAQHRGDPDKLEAAILLSILLDAEQKATKKPVPLGICGLMTVVYEDTFDRAMAEVPDAQEIAGEELTELWRSRRMEKDMAALTAVTKKAKSLDDLERRITSDPDLSLAWRCQQPHLLKALDHELAHLGADFVPGYFTAEEATLAMDRMEEEHLSKPWHMSRYIMTVALLYWLQSIRDVLDEIVTPERQAEIASGLRTAGQRVLERDDPERRALAPHFLAAAENVANDDWPAGNRVLISMYLVSFCEGLSDLESLSPQWQRLIHRMDEKL
jgi:hypothetical protein